MRAGRAGWGVLLLALVLAGCPRNKRKGELEPIVLQPTDASARRTPVEGPDYWSESGGLCLEVPEQWRGSSGPPPHLLSLEHPSGVRLDIRSWSAADGIPLERPGFELLFHDADSYRTVPILLGGGTYTWVSVDPIGPLTQGWYGTQSDRIVAIEATYPFGHATSGREVAQPLLSALCTTYR